MEELKACSEHYANLIENGLPRSMRRPFEPPSAEACEALVQRWTGTSIWEMWCVDEVHQFYIVQWVLQQPEMADLHALVRFMLRTVCYRAPCSVICCAFLPENSSPGQARLGEAVGNPADATCQGLADEIGTQSAKCAALQRCQPPPALPARAVDRSCARMNSGHIPCCPRAGQQCSQPPRRRSSSCTD